jgi:hypothetical protein
MSKPVPHFAVTANQLSDGKVVYAAAGDRWSPSWQDAIVTAVPDERDKILEWAKTQSPVVCGVYALDVLVADDGERKLSQRERLRAAGASTVLDRLKLRPEDLRARVPQGGDTQRREG